VQSVALDSTFITIQLVGKTFFISNRLVSVFKSNVSLFSNSAILIFFTCFLLLNFLIPVSLNVLLEFIKAFLTGFLGFDKKFYDEFCDGIHVGNMSIMEELGVVDYILTDKTGTLTANQMIFKSCCIQDKVYTKTKL
jgi:phospholipid-translocating ATPase